MSSLTSGSDTLESKTWMSLSCRISVYTDAPEDAAYRLNNRNNMSCSLSGLICRRQASYSPTKCSTNVNAWLYWTSTIRGITAGLPAPCKIRNAFGWRSYRISLLRYNRSLTLSNTQDALGSQSMKVPHLWWNSIGTWCSELSIGRPVVSLPQGKGEEGRVDFHPWNKFL
jgi:hypothetical protein